MQRIENAPIYKNLDLKPLQIDLHLASPAVFYRSITLDALLAYKVVAAATRGHGLPGTAEPYYIPLPLEKLWMSPKTSAPLWNATQFFPIVPNAQQTVYWHKRGYRPEMTTKQRSGKPHNANFGQGRHKEYRIPMPQHSALKWRAYCVGDAQEVAGLLSGVHSVGKKRSQGHGRVAHYELMEIDGFDYAHEGRLIKAFPVDFPNLPKYILKLDPPISFSRYETAWTPPYWLETLFLECIC